MNIGISNDVKNYLKSKGSNCITIDLISNGVC